MNGTIRFPHLGITLEHVIRSVHVGGIEIACYGIVLAAAMVTGLLLAMKVAEKTGQNPEDYFDLGIIAIIVSVICARIYYVVFSWDYYREHLSEIWNIRQGGLAIYGGVIGGVLTVWLFCRVRKLRFCTVLDTAVPGLVWGQVVGRWGNFFNREAFGGYTDGLLAMQLPVSDVRAHEITEQMREHLQVIDGVEYIQVHPTFLYESLWNIGVLLILLLVIFRVKKRFQGMTVLMYFLLYGAGRFWIEGLRTDQLLLPGTRIAVSQVLSAVLAAGALVLLAAGWIRERNTKT
ncbi:prolipoprotein diacylglyceryl transferase [Parablautia sp. Marseille-Q6255]|uniref:prolipoprotein diacylglyceryl transferase n=1 Tax=Parablautia sp. Marseille-Q6255 TaxID=3039593 RepID=UPI0024BBFDA9|nr:prolipoprotein diacylglyceryl transferase [Parablautia sp. Marseille-Q6255]